jgi:predicted dehydrogenase
VSRTAFGLPNGLAFDILGVGGRAAFDQHRPAEYLFDDAQPGARTRGARQIIAGPAMPYFKGGVPMEAPGVGASNADNFTYQARAFLDEVAGVADPIPACATFADALRTMEIIRAVVRSSESGGAAVEIPAPV